jgi:ribosomal protein S18 acetylase RimI-like enzyme
VHDLVAIGVDRNYQGHGVGRRLLRRFATRKVSRRVCGGGGMVVVRNWFTESLGFYEKIGFHRRTTFTRCASEWMEGADAGVLCWRYR